MFSFLKEVIQNYVSLFSLVFLIYAVAFTLLSSLFHYKRLLEKYKDDFKAFVLYFVYFSLFLFVIPVIVILLLFPHPLETLKNLGFQPGNYQLGLKIILISMPLCLLSSYIAANDPRLKKYYPFSKNACRNLKTFALYEMFYLFLYYLAWEFTFRGVILFSIAGMMADAKGILIAIFIQTIISTVFHLGHPDTEIFSSLAGGIIFGIIAYATKSFFYSLFVHALIGILNDSLLYVRYYRKK